MPEEILQVGNPNPVMEEEINEDRLDIDDHLRRLEVDQDDFDLDHEFDDDDEAFQDEDDEPIPNQQEEEGLRERVEAWAQQARNDVAQGLEVPPAPEGVIIHGAPDGAQPLRGGQVRFVNVGRHRGGRVVIDDDGRGIPQGINQPPPPPRRAPIAHIGNKIPKVVYLVEGFEYKGYKFSRKLTIVEQHLLAHYGYKDLIDSSPDLLFVEKEVPINEQEECIIVIAELVDYLATQECKEKIRTFDIKLDGKVYQEAYKKYLKAVTSFKQNRNG